MNLNLDFQPTTIKVADVYLTRANGGLDTSRHAGVYEPERGWSYFCCERCGACSGHHPDLEQVLTLAGEHLHEHTEANHGPTESEL